MQDQTFTEATFKRLRFCFKTEMFQPAVQTKIANLDFENAIDPVFVIKLWGSILVRTGENGGLKNGDAETHVWLPD